jgi:arylsulfatase A
VGKSKVGKFGNAVEEIDWSVGEIVRALKEMNLETNTIIFLPATTVPGMKAVQAF